MNFTPIPLKSYNLEKAHSEGYYFARGGRNNWHSSKLIRRDCNTQPMKSHLTANSLFSPTDSVIPAPSNSPLLPLYENCPLLWIPTCLWFAIDCVS